MRPRFSSVSETQNFPFHSCFRHQTKEREEGNRKSNYLDGMQGQMTVMREAAVHALQKLTAI
jgi:hypothetical protein